MLCPARDSARAGYVPAKEGEKGAALSAYRDANRFGGHLVDVNAGITAVLTEAKEAKIPVFLLDRTIEVSDPTLYTAAVASDSVHEGKVAGDWLVKEVAGKPCNVVELQGTVGASVALNRKQGFADAIKAAPNVKIIRSQSAG